VQFGTTNRNNVCLRALPKYAAHRTISSASIMKSTAAHDTITASCVHLLIAMHKILH